MRTVVVFHSGDDSGPARTLEPRLRALAAHGRVAAVFPWPGAAVERYATFADPHVVPVRPLVAGGSLRAARGTVEDAARLLPVLRRERPSLVVCVTTVVPAALLAARMLGVPTLLYAAELLERQGARALRSLERRLATSVVACSHEVARLLPGAEVVYPGISAHPAPSRAEARAALELPAGAYVVAAVGSISRGRGQHVLVEAVRELGGEVECLLAGAPHPRAADLAYRDELHGLVAAAGRGRLLGHVADVERVYAAADLVVNPALVPEAFGRAAVEAVAAERPVIASRAGAAAEVLGGLATLVEPGDARALAAAIEAVRVSPPAAAELASRRDEVLRRYAEPPATRRFVELALAAAGISPAPGPGAPRAPAPGSG